VELGDVKPGPRPLSAAAAVMEVPDDVPVLIGQLPLEHLDLVVDLRSRSLIGNPAHGGEHVYELYFTVDRSRSERSTM